MISSQEIHSLAFESSEFGLLVDYEKHVASETPVTRDPAPKSPPRPPVLGNRDVANVPTKTPKRAKIPETAKSKSHTRAPYYTLVRLCLSSHEVFATVNSWHSVYGKALETTSTGPHAHFQRKRFDMWHVTLCGESPVILHFLLRSSLQYVSVVFGDFDVRSRPHNPQPPSKQNGGLVRVGLTGIRNMTDLIGEIHRVSRASRTNVSEEETGNPKKSEEKENRVMRCDSLRSPRRAVSTGHRLTVDSDPFSESREDNRVLPPSLQLQPGMPDFVQPVLPSSPSTPAMTVTTRFATALSTPETESSKATEIVKLSKKEVTALMGPGGARISLIRNKTRCRIAILPVSLDSINSRHCKDVPQTISLSGTPNQVAHAKMMLRRALVDVRAAQKAKSQY